MASFYRQALAVVPRGLAVTWINGTTDGAMLACARFFELRFL